MSTKIYTAYMLRDRRKLWSVCRKIRERCEARVSRELARLYGAIVVDATRATGKTDDSLKKYRSADGSLDVMDASRFVRDQYGAQLTRSERHPFDLTVCVAIRQAPDGRILLIPYPGSGFLSGSLDFMARMPEIRDYHYQNQTDRPKNITAAQWAERRRTWDPLLADREWRHMLVLDIVSYNGWHQICPAIDMMRKEVRRRNRQKMSRQERRP